MKGIKKELQWNKPSKIQALTIPMISKLFEGQSSYDYLNSQAKSGSGKTGAFVIGSLLRVDSSIDEL